MSLAVDFVPGCQSVVIVQTESGWAGEVLAPSQAGNLWLQLLSPSPQVDILIRQQCISLGWWGVEEGEHISRWSSNCETHCWLDTGLSLGDSSEDTNQALENRVKTG